MPLPLVTNSLVMPVSRLVTVTLTPSTTAPVASVTVPRISPEFVFCANPLVTPKAQRQTARTARDTLHIIDDLPGSTCWTSSITPQTKNLTPRNQPPDRSGIPIQGTLKYRLSLFLTTMRLPSHYTPPPL